MSSKVGIKVPVDSSVVKVVKTVKDIEPLPISKLKVFKPITMANSEEQSTCDFPNENSNDLHILT